MNLCAQCKSEYKRRRISFGRAGWIEMECCECEAMKTQIKYSNTGKADNADEVFQEGL